MKQLFTATKKKLHHSINPPVADSIGTGEEFEAFLRSVRSRYHNSEFRGATTGEPAVSETEVSHSAHTLLGANEKIVTLQAYVALT